MEIRTTRNPEGTSMNTLVLPIVFVIYQVLLALIVRRRLLVVRRTIGKGEGGVSVGWPTAILSAGRISRIASWLVVLIFLLISFASILAASGNTESFTWSSVILGVEIVLAFTWVPWLLVLVIYGSAFAVGDFGIIRYSPWRKVTGLQWEDVSHIGFVPMYDMFIVRGGHGRFFISPQLENIQYFAQGVIDRVPRRKWKDSGKLIERSLKGPFRPDW